MARFSWPKAKAYSAGRRSAWRDVEEAARLRRLRQTPRQLAAYALVEFCRERDLCLRLWDEEPANEERERHYILAQDRVEGVLETLRLLEADEAPPVAGL